MITRSAAVVASALFATTVATAPADAGTGGAGCDGVRVVVDPGELGGEDTAACVRPGTAAEAFEEAGFTLDFVPIQPGFVCRVDGRPANGPCTDGTAYWSLWWSDGETDWTYATLGVTSLEVPAGGAVGFAWHQGKGDAEPPDQPVGAAADHFVEDVVAPPAEDRGDDGRRLLTYGGIALLVLGAAAVPILRRRRAR